MVSLLKDLIRADRERNWNLHLQTAQVCFPVFVLFDCTSYLRWCSLYLEDIRKLPKAALELHCNILAGKFVLKRSPGLFSELFEPTCVLNKQLTDHKRVRLES